MQEENSQRASRKSNYIDGIYNYCDRWCERCPFTSRCRNFAFGRELERCHEKGEEFNEAFWDQLFDGEEPSRVASEFLVEDESEENALENDLDFTFGEFLDRELKQEQLEDHECAKRSWNYMMALDAWQKKTKLITFDEEGHIHVMSPEGAEVKGGKESLVGLDDAFEVVWWYHHFIHVKILRALSGLYIDKDYGDDFPRDYDGSAKIALIAIDRTLAAWRLIVDTLKNVEEAKKAFTQFLVSLAVLRKRVEETFPDARAFVRPGFDTENA
jgi:hypothetical protein